MTIRTGLPLPNTDNSLPVTSRIAVLNAELGGGVSIVTRLAPRRMNASSATTKISSALGAVSTVSPVLIGVCSVASPLLTSTRPETR